uniref:Uncharacterized protein n=1 Tax=Panagrolaimus superbus TaxID=310955 RepID=A0A914Z2S9_9BILA
MAERSKRLSTATAELYYDDYIQRRNKELAKNRPSSKNSQRSVSSGSGVRPNSKSSNRISTGSSRKSSASAASKIDGPKPYEFEAHKYKRNGYKNFDTQLGADPVTAIRTLKSRLRELSISSATIDRPVKSQICQQACDKLTEAEVEMGNLSHQRSQAILHGKVEDAKKISSQMSELRDRVTYSAYTDLLIDRDQV